MRGKRQWWEYDSLEKIVGGEGDENMMLARIGRWGTGGYAEEKEVRR